MNTLGNRKWWALGSLSLALLAVGLDATVLSLALPTLAGELHVSETDLQWFVASYTLALAAMLLPAGLLGDRFGRKKILLAGLIIFGVASVATTYSTSSGMFIAARTVMGIGAAFLIPVSLSVLTVLFNDEERPKAVGVWSAANFLALPIGPILGGWMLAQFWWGSVFLINIPVVVIALVAVTFLLPESRSAERPGLDLPGIVASSLGLTFLIYGLIEAGQRGWGDAGALVFMAVGVLVLAFFLWWERRLTLQPGGQPLIDISLFRAASFTWGTILAAVGVFVMFGVFFTAPQYYEAILGADPQGSGLRLLPLILGFAVGAVLADRVANLVGTKIAAALGFAVVAIGVALGATTTVTSGDWFSVLWTAIVGWGLAVALVTASTGALAELSPERSGVGSGLIQSVNKLGGPFAGAILGSVLYTAYRDHLNLAGLPAQAAEVVQQSVFGGLAVAKQTGSTALLDSVRQAFVSGMDAALWVSCGVAVAGIVLALLFLPRRVDATRKTDVEGVELGHEQELEREREAYAGG